MNRKVIRLSTSTSVVSLPTSWLKKNDIKKGAELSVEEKDNRLIVSKQAGVAKKSIYFSIREINERLVRIIVDALYIGGYDEISIETKNQEQRDNFVKIVHVFPGLIIYDEKGDIIKLKNIALQEEFNLQQIISRIRNLTISLMNDSMDAVKANNWEMLINSKKRDYLINTYVSMSFRHINMYGYSPVSAQGVMAQYIKLLEMFSDKLCLLLTKIGLQKEKNKMTQEILLSMKELYREEALLFSKFSLEKLSEFDEKREGLQNKIKNFNSKLQTDVQEIVRIFFDMEETLTQLNVSRIGNSEENA
ncbi:MAG: AbrB/MazE/SpoVT family DNA-binding domain-containing protein [Candidatus Nanoarchaeia archaeon]